MNEAQASSSGCIFCQIINSQEREKVILETEYSAMIVSLEGHLLVFPKRHIENIFDSQLDPITHADLAKLIVTAASMTQKIYGVEGVSIMSMNGRPAGQEVMHYHTHIIPRSFQDGKIRIREPRLSEEQLKDITLRFRHSPNI